MKFGKIVLKKLKDAGVKDAEKVIVDVFKGIQAACPEVVADPEASVLEKSLAGVAIPVLAGLAPSIEKLADLNHDGQVG